MAAADIAQPIRRLVSELAAGNITSRQLVEQGLSRIGDESGEGSRAFLSVSAERARAEADAVDALRSAGGWRPPYAGIPIAVKDLADVNGEVTTAGSTVLADNAPADGDAPAVARLRAAGFIVIGRTNMTEFAFSGLGLNPHFGTPSSPWDRSTGRIPGGSSSGSAVAVADGMATVSLGTDTGGSCRIPAAFCNIVGYKPTARRVPLDGIVPLAPSLDSVGPLTNTVDCVRITDSVLAGGSALTGGHQTEGAGQGPSTIGSRPLRLGLLTTFVLDHLDPVVADRFEQGLRALSAAGVSVVETPFPELDELAHINRDGGMAPAEALAWHKDLIAERGSEYGQRVRYRIEGGARASATYYLEVLGHRQRLIGRFAEIEREFDAIVLPTVAILPPPLSSFAAFGDSDDPDDRYYTTTNMMALRNTAVGNLLDACAISLPLCRPEDRASAPAVGLMLMAGAMQDARLLAVAAELEQICADVA